MKKDGIQTRKRKPKSAKTKPSAKAADDNGELRGRVSYTAAVVGDKWLAGLGGRGRGVPWAGSGAGWVVGWVVGLFYWGFFVCLFISLSLCLFLCICSLIFVCCFCFLLLLFRAWLLCCWFFFLLVFGVLIVELV